MANTLFDKIWNEHSVSKNPGFPDTLYIDTHFINKVTSSRAFEGLRKRGIPVFRPKQTIVKESGYNPHIPLNDISRLQRDMLIRNCNDYELDFPELPINSERGNFALPGQTLVCEPNDRDNLGAFGVIVLGIDELQVEQVLATQCLLKQKPKRMKIEVNGRLGKGLGAKDINHYLISEISSIGARGYFIEFAGETIINLDMEGRMAICNMSMEIGAVGGIMAPDEKTYDYLSQLGVITENNSEDLLASWKALHSDESSVFDEVLEFDAEDIPLGNYGIGISRLIPSLSGVDIPVPYEGYSIIQACTDTDFMLSQKEDIKDFEKTKTYIIFNGVDASLVQLGED